MNIDIPDSIQFFLYLQEQKVKHKITLITINMNKDKIDKSRKKNRGIAEKRYHMHNVSCVSWIMNICPTVLDKLEKKISGQDIGCVFFIGLKLWNNYSSS